MRKEVKVDGPSALASGSVLIPTSVSASNDDLWTSVQNVQIHAYIGHNRTYRADDCQIGGANTTLSRDFKALYCPDMASKCCSPVSDVARAFITARLAGAKIVLRDDSPTILRYHAARFEAVLSYCSCLTYVPAC